MQRVQKLPRSAHRQLLLLMVLLRVLLLLLLLLVLVLVLQLVAGEAGIGCVGAGLRVSEWQRRQLGGCREWEHVRRSMRRRLHWTTRQRLHKWQLIYGEQRDGATERQWARGAQQMVPALV